MEEGELCVTFKCFCGWRSRCGPKIPRIAPGTDYLAVDDDRPLWSVLVGLAAPYVQGHNLRLHRFRVAASGRVLGESDGLLERFLDVAPEDDAAEVFANASGQLSSRGDRLHIICKCLPLRTDGEYGFIVDLDNLHLGRKYTPLAINLADKTLTPLGGDLPVVPGEHWPILAGGEDWALCVERPFDKYFKLRGTAILRMQRLDADAWVVAAEHEFPFKQKIRFSGGFIQGYVTIGDKILVSCLGPVFFVFDCSNCTWAPVSLSGEIDDYIPFWYRAAYVEDDDTIYFIRVGTLLAYKYSPEKSSLSPPIKVATLFPFKEGLGFGHLVHLVGRVMCAVWFGHRLPCACTTGHLLITTFIVDGDRDSAGYFTPKGVEIMHSTCRRVGISEGRVGISEVIPEFSRLAEFGILQLYLENADQVDPTSIHPTIGEAAYSGIEDSPNMLPCCRMFLKDEEERRDDFVLVDCKTPTDTHLYVLAETAYRSLLYRVSISDGKFVCPDKILEAQCHVEHRKVDHDIPANHFVRIGSTFYMIPSSPWRKMGIIDDQASTVRFVQTERPPVFLSAVFVVGHGIVVGLGGTLKDVCILERGRWQYMETSSSSSLDRTRSISVSGFVNLGDTAFIVADAKTSDCFFLDLRVREWRIVRPRVPYRLGMLFGRSIFIGGFIYTPWEGGLAAFELIEEHGLFYLGKPILFRSWRTRALGSWRKTMLPGDYSCIASVGKDDKHIVFCMVHGSPWPPYWENKKHKVTIATVQVTVEPTGQGKKEPIKAEHVDINTSSSIDHAGWIHTRYAFAP